MNNFVGTVNARHGAFDFCHFDEFIGLAIREYGEFSELELNIILKFINEGNIVFDVGANIGCFSVPLAKKVGSNGKVYSFEPQPFINKLLKKNIQSNNLDNVKIMKEGLGLKQQILELDDIDYSTIGNFGGVGLKTENNSFTKMKSQRKHKVKVIKLDEFLDIKKCDFLKIDAENMDLEVLRGGKKFLQKFRPILWVENLKQYPNKVNKFLIENKYKPFWATTMLYNPDNYFINDNNYFLNVATINTLAIPIEKDSSFINRKWLTEIVDEYTQPLNALTKLRNL
ncbi:MAG: FkbM family methyltransferase [Alphaproteobacteria bacterium]